MKNKYMIKVQRMRIENAGENKMLVKSCDQNEMGIKLEYTTPVTSQQNGVVERAFVTLIGRGRAMMNHARFTVKKRQEMWCEAAQTDTMIDNVLVQEKGDKPPHANLYSDDPEYAKYVRTFGEIGVTAISSNKVARTKLDPRERISLVVKYSLNHLADTYHFINLSTKRVFRIRDVKWLDKTWGQYYNIPTKDMVQLELVINEENENQEEIQEEQEMHEQDISYEEPEEEEGPIAPRTRS